MRVSNTAKTSAATAMVEVDDICAIEPLPQAPAGSVRHEPALDDTVEIELTAEQIDALLSGR
ncbi:MAG TPA: hypothetical protein VH814_23650 [Steroidobacteraceae bacterium]|jgi:hypothetical protein